MTRHTTNATATINGVPVFATLEVEQDQIYLGPSTDIVPDLDWTATDNKGHWHAFANDGTLPTLEDHQIERVEIDHDDCGCEMDRWTETIKRCVICHETVEPKTKIKYNHEMTMPGMKSWHADLTMRWGESVPTMGAKVLFRFQVGSNVAFGVGAVVGSSFESDHRMASIRIAGVGPLGYREGHDA